MKKGFLILAFFSMLFTISAQTYVNKVWETEHGKPDFLEWSASAKDNQSNLITVGNTYVLNENANILIKKINSTGGIVWEKDWDGPQNGSDYGTAVTIDNIGNVYVAGTSHFNNDSTFDIVILKYNQYGTLEWSQNFDINQLDDYPVEIVLDQIGNVFITGCTENSSSDFDYLTLKLNSQGQKIWSATYDYNQNVDIAADIILDEENNRVTVTGGSEDTSGVWDYTTVQYDTSGIFLDVNRQSADESNIKRPKDIVKDDNNFYYLTGINNNGTNNDIKLIKLDSTLNTQWVKVYDSLDDGSNTITIDDSGYIYIGGWHKKVSGIRSPLLLKFNNDGDLIWNKIFWPDTESQFSEITDINIDK